MSVSMETQVAARCPPVVACWQVIVHRDDFCLNSSSLGWVGFHRHLTWGFQGQPRLDTALHRLGCGSGELVHRLGICSAHLPEWGSLRGTSFVSIRAYLSSLGIRNRDI